MLPDASRCPGPAHRGTEPRPTRGPPSPAGRWTGPPGLSAGPAGCRGRAVRFGPSPASPSPSASCSDERPDADFDDAAAGTAEADIATFRQEVGLARAAVDGHSLDETFYQARRKRHVSLRWIYLHMIEEYARHNGHADLIRERIDGAVGD